MFLMLLIPGWSLRNYFLQKVISKIQAKVLRNSSVEELQGEEDVVYKKLLPSKGMIQK